MPRMFLGLAAAVALAGCSTNASRLDRGRVLSASGAEVTTKTQAFLVRVTTARDEANIALVASDPSCAWTSSIVLRGDDAARGAVADRAIRPALCLRRGEPANETRGDVTVPLGAVPGTALRPTVEAIAALAAYLDAVNTVIDGTQPDIAAELADAYGKAVAAQSAIAAITKTELKIVPNLDEKQLSAVTGLIRIIAELAAEQRKAQQLQAVVARQNAEVATICASLKEQVEQWGQSSLAGDLQVSDTVLTSLGRRLGDGQPGDPEARAALIRKIIVAKRESAAVPATIAGIASSIDAMAAAQKDVMAAYTRDPNWSAAERAKQARLNRQRLVGALQAIAAAVSAFAV